MKVGVLGAGLMGTEAARDLLLSDGVTSVSLADVCDEKLNEAKNKLTNDKLMTQAIDATDDLALKRFIERHDVIINALFYTFNKKVAQLAIENGVHAVDLGGHIDNITDEVLTLHDEAEENDVTIIPDLGVAPGMSNILAGYGASQLDEVHAFKLYVGGIPAHPEPPLQYKHVFSLEGVLDHYTNPSVIIRDGKLTEVPSLSEIEQLHFDEFGTLEAFHTSGGTSTLLHSFPNVQTLEYKTIRYPGHAEKFQLLVDLQLTKKNFYVDVEGMKVSPRKVLLKVLDPMLELGEEKDAVLVRVLVTGKKDGKEKTCAYEMTTYKDMERQITAMARATATTISVVAQMIGNQTIKKRGVLPPEQIVPGKQYIEQMKKRHIFIEQSVIE